MFLAARGALRSWDLNYSQHVDGMAENRPGHKKFDAYKLPKWVWTSR